MRKWLLLLAVLIVGAWAAMWIGAATMSRLYSEDARRPWPMGLGTLADAKKRYPPAPVSAGAVRLIAAAAKLGVNIAPKDEQLQPETAPNRNANAQLRLAVQKYLNAQIAKPSASIDPVPAEITEYLAAHAADIAAVRAIAREGDVQWAVDYPDRRAPIPNLLGHLVLTRVLLVNALDRARRGEREAWQDAEAAVALSRNLWTRPELISSLIALAMSRSVNSVARKLPLPAPTWFEEFRRFDYTRALLAARQAETSSIAESLAAETTVDEPVARSVVTVVMKPYAGMCEADALEIERRIAEGVVASRSCAVDVASLARQRRSAAAWWNLPAKKIVTPNLDGAWQRVLRFRAELEATERALRMRAGEQPMPQSACEGLQWVYSESGFRASKTIPGTGSPLEFTN